MPHVRIPGFVTPIDATPQAAPVVAFGPVVRVDAKLRQMIPGLVAISIGDLDDKSTWKPYFADSMTQEQKDAALQTIAAVVVADLLKEP